MQVSLHSSCFRKRGHTSISRVITLKMSRKIRGLQCTLTLSFRYKEGYSRCKIDPKKQPVRQKIQNHFELLASLH